MMRTGFWCWVMMIAAGSVLLAAEPASLEPMPPAEGERPRAAILEFSLANADLIVMGQVTGKSKLAELEFKRPYSDAIITKWVVTYDVSLSSVIADRLGAFPGFVAGPDRPRFIKVISEVPEPSNKLNPPAGDVFTLDLKKDDSYVLILQKMPGRDEYYLPSRAVNAWPADKASIERVTKAADHDKWPWGEKSDGLQMAVFATPLPFSDLPTGKPDGSQRYMLNFVLRNKSDKPVKVWLYPLDVTNQAQATDEKGQTAKMQENRVENLQLPPRQRYSETVLQPGQMLFFDIFGKTDGASFWSVIMLKPGRWTLKASAKFAGKPDDAKTWTGRVDSGEIVVQVPAPTTTSKPQGSSSQVR